MSKLPHQLSKYYDEIPAEKVAVCKLCRTRMKLGRLYVLKQHLKKVHNAKSEIWKYFDNILGLGLAECKTCKQQVRNNRIFNLIKHAEISHNIIIGASEDKPSSTNNTDNVNDTVQNKHLEKLLSINMNENIIKSAIWGLMIDEGVTPSLIGSKNMQSLLKPICDAISKQNEKDFKLDEVETEKMLCTVADDLLNGFTNELCGRLLSLKIDTDINGPSNTCCVSVSFINNEKIEKRMLGIIDLKDESRLSEKHIQQILYKFNIDLKQLVYACWDHTKPKYNNTFVRNYDYLNEIMSLKKLPAIHLGNININHYVGAVAHFCLLDIFKDPNIFKSFLNCRSFVNFINNESNLYHKLFKENNLNIPQLDSPWKWGTTFKMLYDLRQARTVLEKEKYPKLENTEDQFEITDDFWLFIDAFCESVQFIQKAITKYYTEEMHFGDFYAQWLKSKILTAKLATTNNSHNKYISIISSELLKCIEISTNDILSIDPFLACLYMDPRFQHTLSLQQKLNAVQYLTKLWNQIKIYNPEVINTATEFPEEEDNQSDSINDEEDDFLNKFLCKDAHETNSKNADIQLKIEALKLNYNTVNRNILLFWNERKSTNPEIFSLSEICFAIPTTQIYNKNLYAHIYRSDITSNTPSHIREKLVSVRLNSYFIKNALEQFGISYVSKSPDNEHAQKLNEGSSKEATVTAAI